MQPIPFGVRHYKGRSLPVSQQSLTNWYGELQTQDAKNKVVLHACPGLKLFGTAGTGPIQAMHEFADTLFVVSNNTLYSVDSNGLAADRGSMSSATRFQMADNGTQLVIVNPAHGYVYDDGLTQITDVDYLPSSTVAYMDGYFLLVQDGTGNWFISSILDGTAYDSTDYGTTFSNPDNVVNVVSNVNEAWVFGTDSIEIYYNSGQADFPFTRYQGGKIEIGTAAKYSPTKIKTTKFGNTLAWLGSNRRVYVASGYSHIPISDPTVEYWLKQYSDVSDAFGYSYTDEGHEFFVLTFPTANATWCYDFATEWWHCRAYWDTTTHSFVRHRSNAYAYAYNKHLVGDFENGNLYELDLDTYTDNGDALITECVFPPLHAGGELVKQAELWVDFEDGVGRTTGQGTDPQAMLQWSNDARTWSNEHWRSIGKIGEYKNRAKWHRLGQFRERVFKLRMSDPVKRTVMGAYFR